MRRDVECSSVVVYSDGSFHPNVSFFQESPGKELKIAKTFSKMRIFPVDEGSLPPSYTLKSPSFDGKMMEINPK
jgi:hypothetical protein